MNDHEGLVVHSPKLVVVRVGHREQLDEAYPIVDRQLHELTQVSVQDVLEASDDAFQLALLVGLVAALEEVVVLPQLVLDLADQEVTPLDHHVLSHSLMVGRLNLLKLVQLTGQLEHSLVGVHEALLLEVDALLDEDAGHGNQILVRAEVLVLDLVVVVVEAVLGAANHSEVGRGFLRQTDRDLHPREFLEVGRVLHFFLDHALLHLADVFFFHYAEQVLECRVDLVRVELVALAH
mmetsp:Transcript_20668/g.31557  ORF Transcript_20668/g.31557 Transcript_20668/m.31557 type:complete len:236 (+) Transcript_20668:6263-6970(+)